MPTRRGFIVGLLGLAVRPQEQFILNYQGGFVRVKLDKPMTGSTVTVRFPKAFTRYTLILLQAARWPIRLWCGHISLSEAWVGWESIDGAALPAVEFTWFAFMPTDGSTMYGDGPLR